MYACGGIGGSSSIDDGSGCCCVEFISRHIYQPVERQARKGIVNRVYAVRMYKREENEKHNKILYLSCVELSYIAPLCLPHKQDSSYGAATAAYGMSVS